MLDEYLSKTDELMSSTPEGRAFEGAFTLLPDDKLLLDLKKDLQAILNHSFSVVLTASEQRDFLSTVAVIRKGIDDVLTRRSRVSSTLRDHIVNHDVVEERELEALLRDINKQLAHWMTTAKPRSFIPVELMPTTAAVHHLRLRFHDPETETSPPPLEDVSAEAPAPPSLEEILKQGGPLRDRMRQTRVGDPVEVGAGQVRGQRGFGGVLALWVAGGERSSCRARAIRTAP
ncbi:hypothetical protein BBK82_35930 [Lentzea guizhouensis]|uniref:Uncharacterized protein n=1 Tax=Lentzea guizhouensis TaxID=1586287 RepID=A0A1B2HSD8_9PSEU|nr:hypothetical protein BBK82_35930 [Lentzea guizhouensis]